MTPQQIVDLLNDAVRCDREAIQALLRATVPCNQALTDHPTIVVWGWDETPEKVNKVGLGGLLTAIAMIDGDKIESVWDDETLTLVGFRLRNEDEKRNLEMAMSVDPLDAVRLKVERLDLETVARKNGILVEKLAVDPPARGRAALEIDEVDDPRKTTSYDQGRRT
jgi:hypothetical protein